MILETPKSYSPSSISQFVSCPLAFRYSYIEKRERPPQYSATKGSIVHRALELLFQSEPSLRTLNRAKLDLEIAFDEYSKLKDLVDLNLDKNKFAELKSQCEILVEKYFDLEDPKLIRPVGLELKLEATVNGNTLRGIIDRLELDEDGELVISDYKSGSVPYQQMENSKMDAMHIYSLLCLENFGRLPSKIQLIYLSKPVTIIGTPTLNSVKSVTNKSIAISKAVETAVKNSDFRPKVSKLCDWCSFHELCPAQGGKIPE